MKIPGLSNSQTTDLLHVIGATTFGGSVLITWLTAIWAALHPGAVAWVPPPTIVEIGGACVAGGVLNGKFCPDEGH